jgi:serine/threonine-protein kinase
MASFNATIDLAARFKRLAQVKSGLGQKTRSVHCFEESVPRNKPLDQRFRLDAWIDNTEMSAVYRATDLTNGQTVAVKSALDEKHCEFITHEIRLLSRLNHPNIVNFIAAGSTYLVEEFLPGALLDRLALTPEEALVAGYHILDVMRHAHSQDIVIRDLKPGNIMVTPAGEIKMFDFGLAKDLRSKSDLGNPGDFFCTPEYAPPEMITLGSFFATPAADYYSLGVALFQCLTRGFPQIRRIMVGCRVSMVSFPANGPVLNENNLGRVPAHLRPLLDGLLQREPEQRLTDPEQAQQLIIEALTDQ